MEHDEVPNSGVEITQGAFHDHHAVRIVDCLRDVTVNAQNIGIALLSQVFHKHAATAANVEDARFLVDLQPGECAQLKIFVMFGQQVVETPPLLKEPVISSFAEVQPEAAENWIPGSVLPISCVV